MIHKPKISVIIAVYNGEKYLSEAIESILNQTFKDFELIIINDKSTDDSLRIVKKYMEKDKRIVLINNKNNSGPAASRNNGLKISKGKYIAILDSDDVALSNRLELQYKYLEKNKEIFLIGGGTININGDGRKLSIFHPITKEKKIKRKMLSINCFYHPTVMFRNKKDIRYREKLYYAHDRDFYLTLLSKNKRITNIPNLLIKYRMHPQQISTFSRVKQYLFAKKAKEFYHQRLEYGKDEYNLFNPQDVFNFNILKSEDPELFEAVAHSNFIAEDYKEAIVFFKKYFEKRGFFNKSGIKYILSKLGYKYNLFNRFNRFLLKHFG